MAWKRGMLLGVRFVLIVPLWYKLKLISPRDADTADALCLEVCYVPAVCEPPCLLGKRFSRRLTYLDFRGKYQTLTEDKRG